VKSLLHDRTVNALYLLTSTWL